MVSEGVEPGVVAGLALCDVTKGQFHEAFVWIRLFSADGGKVSLASYGDLDSAACDTGEEAEAAEPN